VTIMRDDEVGQRIVFKASTPYQYASMLFLAPSDVAQPTEPTKEALLILPALSTHPETTNIIEKELGYRYDYIETFDNALLELTVKHSRRPIEAKPIYMVKFNGNGVLLCLEDEAHQDLATELGVSIVGFNYRGVGNSKKIPTKYQDLVVDGISVVEYVMRKLQIPAEQIILHGHSLGGSVATKVASYFARNKQYLGLINDRSFSATAMVFEKFFLENIDATASALDSNWSITVTNDYLELPDHKKICLAVTPTLGEGGEKGGDEVITHEASLFVQVKASETDPAKMTTIEFSFPGRGHSVPLNRLKQKDDLSKDALDVIREFIMRFSTPKLSKKKDGPNDEGQSMCIMM
jgi:hypothetical protein